MKKMLASILLVMFIFSGCVNVASVKSMDKESLKYPTGSVGILVTQGDKMLACDRTVKAGLASNLYLVNAPQLNYKISKNMQKQLNSSNITNIKIVPSSRVDIERFFISNENNNKYKQETIKNIINEYRLKSLIVVSRRDFGGLKYETDTATFPIRKLNSEKEYAAGVVVYKFTPFFTTNVYIGVSFNSINYYLNSQNKLLESGYSRLHSYQKIGLAQDLWKGDKEPSYSEVMAILNKIDKPLDEAFANIKNRLKIK